MTGKIHPYTAGGRPLTHTVYIRFRIHTCCVRNTRRYVTWKTHCIEIICIRCVTWKVPRFDQASRQNTRKLNLKYQKIEFLLHVSSFVKKISKFLSLKKLSAFNPASVNQVSLTNIIKYIQDISSAFKITCLKKSLFL